MSHDSAPGTSGNNEDNRKRNLELPGDYIDSSDIGSEYLSDWMMTSLLKNSCKNTNVVGEKYNHQHLLANMLMTPSVCHQRI